MLDIFISEKPSSDLLRTLFEEIESQETKDKNYISYIKTHSYLIETFLSIFGLKTSIELILSTGIETYKHFSELLRQDAIFTKNILEKVKDLDFVVICEFFIFCAKMGLRDRESLTITRMVSEKLTNTMSLLNLIELPENYAKNIIYNKSCFSKNKKVEVLVSAAKNLMCANIIKKGNLFLNTSKTGYIPKNSNCSNSESCLYGLFYNDMQYIDSYNISCKQEELQLKPTENILDNNESKSFISLSFEDKVFVRNYRKIANGLVDEIEIFNNSTKQAQISIDISSKIRDIFHLRGNQLDEECFTIELFGENIIAYTFSSGNVYSFEIEMQHKGRIIKPEIELGNECKISYRIAIDAAEGMRYELKIRPKELQESANEYFNIPKIEISGDVKNLQKTIDRCIKDINLLTNSIEINGNEYKYLCAGLPRYGTLFGRDSILSALALMDICPEVARNTIEILAHFQGKTFDDRFKKELQDIDAHKWSNHSKEVAKKALQEFYNYREEAKGKIIHEIRFGELSKTGEAPHSSYFGTIDATPLWLILIAKYYQKTNDEAFWKKHLPNIEEALLWTIENFSDGYLKFVGSCSINTIQNQGWKDANDSLCHILDLNGMLKNPTYPVALAEVQAYVYKAFDLVGDVFNKIGQPNSGRELKEFCSKLKERFNKDFFLPEKGFYATALDANNKPLSSQTSNIGHCLTFGIIDDAHKSLIEDYLTSECMFSGYGIRTLCSSHQAYDPLSYHNGSVWVHDTLINAIGLSKESQENILKALFEVANHFPNNHMPELFAGFSSKSTPILYPDTCIPQAWAASGLLGSLFRFIQKHGNPLWIKGFKTTDD